MKTTVFFNNRTTLLGVGWWLVTAVLLGAAGVRAAEPTFTNVTAAVAPGLPKLQESSVSWADFDGDGRLDFLITGYSTITMSNADDGVYNGLVPISQLWWNTGSGFTNVTATLAPGLPGVFSGSVAWGDYDNDGRLDFLLTGYDGVLVSQLWRNTGSGFSNVTATVAPGLPGVAGGSVAWGDYDNDGRLDFIITGLSGYASNGYGDFISQIWRNTGSGFTNVTGTVAPGLPGVYVGSVAWGDYDNDGRLDFLLIGGAQRPHDQDDDPDYAPIAQLWRNTGSGFKNVTAAAAPGLMGVHWGSVAWADYDNDGRLDFLISGWNRDHFTGLAQLWRNTGNGFVNVTATVAPGLPQAYFSSLAWGDYDNDGRPDFLLTGLARGGISSQVWRNTGNGFTNVTASVAPGLAGVVYSSVAWADYDNDGWLDFLLTGALDDGCDVCDTADAVSQLWRNQTTGTTPPPSVITGLPSDVSQTAAGLNARINPRSHATTAWFVWGDSTNYGQVTAAQPMGSSNSFASLSQTIPGLSTGLTYYYRAIASNDLGQVVLGFGQSFTVSPPSVTTSPAGNLGLTSGTLNGHVNPHNLPSSGWFEWGTTPAYGQITTVQFLGGGFDATLSQNLSGLEVGHTYYFRAVASNSVGVTYGASRNFATPAFANVTATLAPGLPQLYQSAMAWGDFDNDGRLDFLITGLFYDEDGFEIPTSQLWRNTGSGFENVTATVGAGLPQVYGGALAWGDYDNDGRLDLIITGLPHEEYYISQLWRNTGSGFTKVRDLPSAGYGSVAWGDYDNDGRLDFLITGYDEGLNAGEGGYIGQLWRNTASGFLDVTASVAPGLPAGLGFVAWADYDNDGWMDFLIVGGGVSQLWRNTGSAFTNVTAAVAPGLPGVQRGSVAWGDYDNDGRLDFLLAGFEGSDFICQLWRNTGSGFTNVTGAFAPPAIKAIFPISSSVAWGDYDNDGRLDVLLSGRGYPDEGTNSVSQIWRNTGSGFEIVTLDLPAAVSSYAWGDYDSSWADFDNDGRLDFFLSGPFQLWRNNTPITNMPPSAPTGLAMTRSSNAVMLSWNSATDDQTPASGLTYNVRAGTTPGGNNLLSAHVNATNGFRRVPAMGNAMLRHSLPLTGLTDGQTVYWSVQAVDTSFAGGPFATETSVVSIPQLAITPTTGTNAIVSWAPPTFGWLLQHSTNLSTSNWTPTPSGSANPATLPATNAARFYRLSKP